VAVVSRNRNPTYILVAGIVVALLGGILVVVLVSQPGSISVPGQSVSVVVASHDIAARASVGSGDLTVVKYQPDAVPSHSFTDVNQVKGFAAVALARNTPLTSDVLVSAPAAAPTTQQGVLDVPAGQVAVAIPSGDPINNVAGFVQSGDHVDILVRGLPGQPPGQVAATFRDLTVQLVNSPASGGATSSGQATPRGNTWVVFVPVDQAMQLVYLFSNGQYTFVLRSHKDVGAPTIKAGPVGPSDFNGTYGIH
jgi:Flp pilus assembly protein CpaB